MLDLEQAAIHLGHGGPSNEDAVGRPRGGRGAAGRRRGGDAGAGIGAGELGAAVLAVAGTDTEAVAEHVRAAQPTRGSW